METEQKVDSLYIFIYLSFFFFFEECFTKILFLDTIFKKWFTNFVECTNSIFLSIWADILFLINFRVKNKNIIEEEPDFIAINIIRCGTPEEIYERNWTIF